MGAPEDVATWMATHEHKDKNFPHVYKYHSRSDIHSIILCEFVMRDLLARSLALREQALRGEAAYGVNVKYRWETTGKSKALDLAIGPPTESASTVPSIAVNQIRRVRNPKLEAGTAPIIPNAFSRLLIGCEAKAVMTEHGKSQPRLFDELSSSHEILHQGDQETIAAGIVMVNIASTFVSPLRQKSADQLHISHHQQPLVASRVVEHLRGLRIRDNVGEVGFDAFCTFVVDCDNQTGCTLFTDSPAPQPGDLDHYDTFIDRITRFYEERFGKRRQE
jgi:hypothetical protein